MPSHGAQQPVAVADVADQEADVPAAMPVALVELLGLVAPEDAHDGRRRLDQMVDQARADRPGTAGDEHATAAEMRAIR